LLSGGWTSPGGQGGRKVPSETPEVNRLLFFPDQLGRQRGGRGGWSREAAGIQTLWLIF